MRICQEFKDKVIDYIEHAMPEQERNRFEQHLNCCEYCQKEYTRVSKLYELFDKDVVPVPEQAFFDKLKTSVRQREIRLRKFRVSRLVKVLIPAFAVVMLTLYVLRPGKTVRISVPTSVLLEDETIAEITLGGIIDDKLINELIVVEDNLPIDINEMIPGLNDVEKAEFIEILDKELSKLQEDV
ncbi:MAG: zf-HC2 domain-containing protein [bacterium]